MTNTNNDDNNVTLEKAYNKLVDFIDNSSPEQPQWKWWIHIAIIPISTLIFSTIASFTTFEIQRRVDRSNTEQAAVESYFMQMEDILINLEGVEGIIKWSRVTEKEKRNFNKEIKRELRLLSSIEKNLSLIESDLSSIESNLSSREQPTKEDASIFFDPLNNSYKDLLSLLTGVEKIDIMKGKTDLEDKLHDIEFKLEEIKKIPDYKPKKYQIDDEILPVHNQILQVQQEILEQTSKISTIVEKIKDIDHDRKSEVDSYLLEEAQIVVQTKTSNVLFSLRDQVRRQAIIEFLRESQLGFIPRSSTGNEEVNNIDDEEDDNLFKKSEILSGMALTRSKGIDLTGNDLSFIQLKEGKLNGAILKNAQLSQSMLSNASLIGANLSGASLFNTNLEGAILRGANLKDANLTGANLKDAIFDLRNKDDLNKTQIKSACNWKHAIYKSKWDAKRETWTAEADNEDFIKEIENHESSDPKIPSICSQWENVNNEK